MTTIEAEVRSDSARRWVKRSIVLALIVAAALFIWINPLGIEMSPAAVAGWLEGVAALWWAPIVFIAAYTLFNVLLVPATILSLTAGVIWGWWLGGLWVLAASTIGSFVPYLIARSGSSWVENKISARAGKLYEKLRAEGFITLLMMRLIPIVPYNILNYAGGLAGIRPRDYVLATFFGTIPGIFIFTYLADSIKSGILSPGAAFLRILTAGVLLGTLVLITRLFAGRVRKRIE